MRVEAAGNGDGGERGVPVLTTLETNTPSGAVSDTADACWPLNDDRLRWYAYARVAWWHLLAALRHEAGDNIVMPDLICDVMTEPLQRLGLQARYYTAEPLGSIKAADLSPHVDACTRAVLAVHYFGMPSELREAAEYCQQEGVPLIEDASQAMLTRDESRPVGHYGSAVLFSFRKTLKLPHGAGLICNDGDLDEALAATPAQLATPRRDVGRFWAKRADRRWFGGRCEKLVDAIRARRSTSNVTEESQTPEDRCVDPFDPCMVHPSRTARWLTLRWDIAGEVDRRRAAFAQLANRWERERLPGRPLVTRLTEGWVPYAFALEPDNAGAEQTCSQLQALGLQAEVWPRLPEDAPATASNRRKVLILL